MNEFLLYGVAITALVVSDVLLVWLGGWAYHRYRRPSERRRDACTCEELQQDLKALAASVNTLGENLARLRGQLERRELQQPTAGGIEAVQKTFAMATRMALQGADVKELINLCGLTRGEAEIIRMLHRSDEQASGVDPAVKTADHPK